MDRLGARVHAPMNSTTLGCFNRFMMLTSALNSCSAGVGGWVLQHSEAQAARPQLQVLGAARLRGIAQGCMQLGLVHKHRGIRPETAMC